MIAHLSQIVFIISAEGGFPSSGLKDRRWRGGGNGPVWCSLNRCNTSTLLRAAGYLRQSNRKADGAINLRGRLFRRCGSEVSVMKESGWTFNHQNFSREWERTVGSLLKCCSSKGPQQQKAGTGVFIDPCCDPWADQEGQKALTEMQNGVGFYRIISLFAQIIHFLLRFANPAGPTPHTINCQITWPNQQGSRDVTLKTHPGHTVKK